MQKNQILEQQIQNQLSSSHNFTYFENVFVSLSERFVPKIHRRRFDIAMSHALIKQWSVIQRTRPCVRFV